MHKYKETTGKFAWVALKLDMEKTYDILEWDFIHTCLKVFNFHNIWIKWIMECITSVSYSLLINNELTGFIKPSRGIRQGDPLSPYIFIMCMELLANNLIRESSEKNSGLGVKLYPKADCIPGLLFADDCLIFGKADTATCRRIKLPAN